MSRHDWQIEHTALVKLLRDQLGSRKDCAEVIDGYESLMRSIWSFISRFLGNGGARAVLDRSVELAARDVPLLRKVRVHENEVDFAEFRDYVIRTGCGTPEVLDALVRLGVTIFHTLSELSGNAVTGPLLRHLEQEQE